jgi:hypothetical protein
LAALTLLFWSGLARAQLTAAGDAIRLELDDCEDVSGASVRGLVVLEVAPRPVLAADNTAPAATLAQLSCQAGVAAIVVEDEGSAALLRLEIALSDLAQPARSRSLALAVAELIATSRLQRQQPTAAVAAPVQTAETEVESYAPPVLSEPTRHGVQLWLAAGAGRMAQPSMLGPLGALGVIAFWGGLAITSDLRFEHAQRTENVAELLLNAGSLALAPAWRVHASSADLLIGAGLRAGYASLRASPRESSLAGESVHGFWLAPCAQVAVQVRLARSWALRIGIEAAYVTRTLRGLDTNGVALLELRDLTLAAQLGVTWDLSVD